MGTIDPNESIMNYAMDQIKNNLVWDFNVEKEFINRKKGYGFVIDLRNCTPFLVLYKMAQYVSVSHNCPQQPPQELMLEALRERGVSLEESGLYNINSQLRTWIEENILK
ncbi:hypothetical protein Dtox_1812 [Desulfofarcimen acetoxidans DSM 771]|jgi:hypothetical protein|uniref:Uncharacterized protein n=1 Tax=Desulfofarcimen acetoxidans (strain ATCC 49208 / DSM 771 / KCTC 5769 / VKM B-1644 / 5575) TaxID=485916 RepID=C8VXK9_DESAS|nr:hypothetical protein [Desulfofarcimen acetoxidans]ACV62665.1 hypothetical protein Dtox_1812 [Desulfofarcimen acetoxidans DSM 771]